MAIDKNKYILNIKYNFFLTLTEINIDIPLKQIACNA